MMAPLTAHTDAQVTDNVIDNLDEFNSIPWSDFQTGHINTTGDLTKRDVDYQALPVLNTLDRILHETFAAGNNQDAEPALKALLGILLAASAVSTNVTVETADARFHTPSPANVAETARQAIKSFRAGDGHKIVKQLIQASKRARSLGAQMSEDERKIQAATTAISHGHISKGKRILSSHGLAPALEETARSIQDKYYPQPSALLQNEFQASLATINDFIRSSPNDPTYEFTHDEIIEAIGALPEETAADTLGLRPGHIKKLMALGFRNVINLICTHYHRHSLPPDLQNILRGGTMIPLVKNPAENTQRPIVVTCIFPKIVDHILLKRHQKKIVPTLVQPVQYGIGHNMATEKVALLVRAAIYKDPTHGVIQFDFKNAYGTISRALVLKELIKRNNKDLIRAFYNRYHNDITLQMHLDSGELRPLQVHTGLLQGDTLAPLFFSLGIHNILHRVYNNEGRDCSLLVAYLDDLTAVGSLDTLKHLASHFQGILDEEKSGLSLEWSKTVIFSPTTDAALITNPPPWKAVAPTHGIKVLGVFMGAPAWVKEELTREVISWTPLLTSLERLPVQHALLTLRLCVVQQFNFIQRHTPTSLSAGIGSRLHDLIWASTRNILDISNQDMAPQTDLVRARHTAELPLRQGGLGLTNPAIARHAAFLGGVGDCIQNLKDQHQDLYTFLTDEILHEPYNQNNPINQIMDRGNFHSDIQNGLSRVRSNIDKAKVLGLLQNISDAELKRKYPCTPTQLLHPHEKLQNSLCRLEQDIHYRTFFNTLDGPRRAVNLSESSPGASGFLQAVPSSISLFMPDETFRAAVRDRLMIPPLNGPVPECTLANCPIAHLSTHDPDSASRELRRHRHGMGACARHARVVKQVRLMLASVNIPTTPEPTVQSDPVLRGDIAENHTHNRGYKTVYDVSITDTTKGDTLHIAAQQAGAAAAHTKQIKNNNYLNACRAINAHFYPLIFETSGFMDKSVFDLITQISSSLHNEAEFIPEYTTWAAPSFKQYWLQRLSIAVRGGSAEMTIRNWTRRVTAQGV